MENEIENIIKLIKFKTGSTIEQIANKIGYSREYLTSVKNSGKGNKVINVLKKEYKEILQNVIKDTDGLEENTQDIDKPYHKKRLEQKLNNKAETIPYYDISVQAADPQIMELLPTKTPNSVLYVKDLFKNSEYVVRISSNSMLPNYPPGALIGIRQIFIKDITPGSVYCILTDSEFIIKRVYFKDDDQGTDSLQLISDNTMVHESGPRKGKYCYPAFNKHLSDIRKIFSIIAFYKDNVPTLIN